MKLPKTIIYVGLSATIDGPDKLGKWSQTSASICWTWCNDFMRNTSSQCSARALFFMSIPDSNFKKMNTKQQYDNEFVTNLYYLNVKINLFKKTYDKIKRYLNMF